MLPPPCQGWVASRMAAFPYTTPMPVGAKTLWPEKTNQSASRACTLTRRWETDWAPSTSTLAPARWARSTISFTGVMVPRALETWVMATSLVFSLSSFWTSSRRIWPSSSTGMTRIFAPFSAASCCQGTMLAWCSRMETTISSPAPMFWRPQLWATRLMASVAPRTKMISLAEGAPMKRATLFRADS